MFTNSSIDTQNKQKKRNAWGKFNCCNFSFENSLKRRERAKVEDRREECSIDPTGWNRVEAWSFSLKENSPRDWGGQFSRDSFPPPTDPSLLEPPFLYPSRRNLDEIPSTHPDHSIMSNSLSISQPFVPPFVDACRISTPLLRRFSRGTPYVR